MTVPLAPPASDFTLSAICSRSSAPSAFTSKDGCRLYPCTTGSTPPNSGSDSFGDDTVTCIDGDAR